MTLPLLVVAAVIIVAASDSGPSGPPGPLEVAAPPHYAAQTTNCTKVLEKLPIDLGKLTPRIVHTKPETPFVVAWGNPAVVLQCGVDRPSALRPGSSKRFRTVLAGTGASAGSSTGPSFDVTKGSGDFVWTTVDRAAYVSVTIPSSYDGLNDIIPLARAIGSALPQVCAPAPAAGVPLDRLCTHRP